MGRSKRHEIIEFDPELGEHVPVFRNRRPIFGMQGRNVKVVTDDSPIWERLTRRARLLPPLEETDQSFSFDERELTHPSLKPSASSEVAGSAHLEQPREPAESSHPEVPSQPTVVHLSDGTAHVKVTLPEGLVDSYTPEALLAIHGIDASRFRTVSD